MAAHLTHVALFVADVGRTVEFYSRFVGLHIVHDRDDDGVRVVWLSEQEHHPHFVIVAIQMQPAASGDPPRMAHFGYDLPSRSSVDEMAKRGAAEGVLVQGPIDAGKIVGYFCMLRDPDGNLVEFSHGQPIDPQRLEDE
jgi:catechol 2,3-dioxygenase-like lactoylglutathione lyase family enzyme